jgi:hypothetical protein
MFSYGIQSYVKLFIIIYVNVKVNLNQYKYHGHIKVHVNLYFHILVDGPKKRNEIVIRKGMKWF